MKKTAIKKWTLGTLLTIISLSIASCLGIKSQIRHHNGGDTERVDPTQFKIATSPLAITNVSVLATDCTKMIDSITVLIKNGKILNVDNNSTRIPKEFKIIDGSGKYLIPGLIDTHVHLRQSKNDLLLYLANGVTQIGEMFGNENHLQWRKEAEEGSLSPKIYVATRKLGSKKGIMPKIRSWFGSMLNYTSEKTARKAVREFKAKGYDAIKLSSFLSPKIYDAIVDEAKQQQIPTIGHLSIDVGLEKLYTSGQSQLAHVEEITKATMRDFGGRPYIFKNNDNVEAYLSYLRKNADAIAIKIKENNIVVSTTITAHESAAKQDLDLLNFIKTIKLEYMNPGIVEGSKFSSGWLPGNNYYENPNNSGPEGIKRAKIYWKTYLEAEYIMTRALVRNDVMITAGTDSNATGTIAGFSLHDELQSLNKIGLSNSQVLYAATVAPSEWMHSNAGKIEVGFRADLVLLLKNPLENISNTRTINAVISNGKLINRLELDKVLLSIKQANTKSRQISIKEFID